MTEQHTILAAFAAASRGINLINRVADDMVDLLAQQEPYPREHRLTIEGTSTEIVETNYGQSGKTISSEDLKNLPEDLLTQISIYERAAENQLVSWGEIYPKRNTSTNQVENDGIEKELKQIAFNVKEELEGILAFLESAGFILGDHYFRFRDVIRRASV